MADETAVSPVAPGMEGLMQRRKRKVLPPKRPVDTPAKRAPGASDEATNQPTNAPVVEAGEVERAQSSGAATASLEPRAASRPKAKRQPVEKAKADWASLGAPEDMVNLNIRVRRGVDDRIATCVFGLREFGLRHVSKAELVELCVIEGALPTKATAELAAQLTALRAQFPRP